MGVSAFLAILPAALVPTLAVGQSLPPVEATSRPEASVGAAGGSGDIVVTAQRRTQRLTEVPISVSVLPASVLDRQAVLDTRQIVQISPAVTFSEGNGDRGASFSIRGISSTAIEGGIQPSVALVIDGVPVARQGEFISAFLDVKQVEVLSGPQGTLFGKNATAGVINILTNDPTGRFETTGEATYTSDDEKVIRATVNVPVSPGLRLRLSGLYDDQAPIVRNVGTGGDVAGARTYAVNGKLAVDLAPDVDLVLQGDYRDRRSSYGAALILVPNSGALGDLQRRALGVPIGRGEDVVNQDGRSFTRSSGWSVAGTVNWRLSSRWKLTSITAHRMYDFDNSTDIDAGPTGWVMGRGFSPNPLGYPIGYIDRGLPRQPSHAGYTSEELRLGYTAKRFDLVLGGFLQTYRERLRGSSPFFRNGLYIDGAVLSARYRDRTAAAFADATYELVDRVKAFAGLRFNAETVGGDYLRTPYQNSIALFDPATGVDDAAPVARFAYDASRTDHNLSGRAGIQYLPNRRQNYYFSFNRGFKGAAIDVSSGWATGSRIFADPELATAFEIGTRQTILDGRLFLSASLYHQIVKNVQQTTVLPSSTTLAAQLQNAGDIRSNGGEAQVNLKATRSLGFNAGVAYTHARYRGGVTACNVSQLAGLQPGCSLDSNGDGVPDSQSLTGHRAKETPEWSLNLGADYSRELARGGRVFGSANAAFFDSIQYQLLNDPLTVEPSHWVVNASIGYETAGGHWRITLFGKNLTNQFYYANIGQTDGFIGRAWARIARDAERYGGVSVRARW